MIATPVAPRTTNVEFTAIFSSAQVFRKQVFSER
jgi:hypothetical protein